MATSRQLTPVAPALARAGPDVRLCTRLSSVGRLGILLPVQVVSVEAQVSPCVPCLMHLLLLTMFVLRVVLGLLTRDSRLCRVPILVRALL